MFYALKVWWPLLLGVVAIQLGNGLLSTSVGLAIDVAGFSATSVAIVMSGFYAGEVLSSMFSARFIARVRHVPAYVALAAITALAPSAFLVGQDVVVWTSARFIYGFGLAGLFIVVESWLNDRVPNETRGRVFSVYILVQLGALMASQFLVPVFAGDLGTALLLVMGFGALAIIPVALGNAPRPEPRPHVAASFRALVAASPVGVVGAAVSGLVWAIVAAMAPIYAARSGFGVDGAAYLVAAAMLGGLLLQWPLGWVSDIRDRRTVLCAMSALAALAAIAGAMGGAHYGVALGAILAFGGLTFPFYSIAVAHVNDRVDPSQRVPASAAMILLFGVGSVAGPATASGAMAAFGPSGFFWLLAAVTAAYAAFILYRTALVRPSAPKPA